MWMLTKKERCIPVYPMEERSDFQIDQILYKCRASSKKVGGGGIRYTVMIRGKESFLFHEGDKWFVEAKESS